MVASTCTPQGPWHSGCESSIGLKQFRSTSLLETEPHLELRSVFVYEFTNTISTTECTPSRTSTVMLLRVCSTSLCRAGGSHTTNEVSSTTALFQDSSCTEAQHVRLHYIAFTETSCRDEGVRDGLPELQSQNGSRSHFLQHPKALTLHR